MIFQMFYSVTFNRFRFWFILQQVFYFFDLSIIDVLLAALNFAFTIKLRTRAENLNSTISQHFDLKINRHWLKLVLEFIPSQSKECLKRDSCCMGLHQPLWILFESIPSFPKSFRTFHPWIPWSFYIFGSVFCGLLAIADIWGASCVFHFFK